MQKTLWKSFLKKRVKQKLLAKQESCRQKSICWNCYKQSLKNKSLKNQRSSIDLQDFSVCANVTYGNGVLTAAFTDQPTNTACAPHARTHHAHLWGAQRQCLPTCVQP